MVEAKVIPMLFNLLDISKQNNINSKDFIVFLVTNNFQGVKPIQITDDITVFMIQANHVKASVEAFKKIEKSEVVSSIEEKSKKHKHYTFDKIKKAKSKSLENFRKSSTDVFGKFKK